MGQSSIMIEIWCVDSQPFTSGHCYFIIVESVTYQMLLQQPKQLICQKVWTFSKTLQPDTADIKHKNSRCDFTRSSNPPNYSPDLACQTVSCLDCWSYTWEVTDTTIRGKWKFLFVNNCKCKGLLSTVKLDHSRKRLLVTTTRASECCIRKDMVAVIVSLSPSLYWAISVK